MPTILTAPQATLISNLAAEYNESNADLDADALAAITAATSGWLARATTHETGVSRYIDNLIAATRSARQGRRERDAQRRTDADVAAMREVGAAQRQAVVSPGVPSAQTPIPDGHYAVESPEAGDNQPLRFYRFRAPRVRYGTRERSTTVQYVYRMESGNARYLGPYSASNPTRSGPRIEAIVNAIHQAGILESSQRYGVEIGRCCCCNRALTDLTSRSLGIGPDCRGARSHHAYWAGRTLTPVQRTSTAPLSTEPQECNCCHDVAVGMSSRGEAWCDECAIDSNVRLDRMFPVSARRRSAAVA